MHVKALFHDNDFKRICAYYFLCSFPREMYKRAQGRTRIGKKNFKKRWFCLTSRELTYHKQQGSNAPFLWLDHLLCFCDSAVLWIVCGNSSFCPSGSVSKNIVHFHIQSSKNTKLYILKAFFNPHHFLWVIFTAKSASSISKRGLLIIDLSEVMSV